MSHKILDNINSPTDIKNLSEYELNELADEIRTVIIETVSENGGHLASNLGVVELTLAIHKVFNMPVDKLVWDVGHQSYAHKIITGRKNQIHTIRKENGLSGFPKRYCFHATPRKLLLIHPYFRMYHLLKCCCFPVLYCSVKPY